MGCNCGKRTRPMGSAQTPASTASGRSTVTTTTTTFRGMTQTFARATGFMLVVGSEQFSFGSELEAKAARKRAGGGTIIPA